MVGSLRSWVVALGLGSSLLVGCGGGGGRSPPPPKGDGTFRPAPQPLLGTGVRPTALVTADFDGDGFPDLATASFDVGTVSFTTPTMATGRQPDAAADACFRVVASRYERGSVIVTSDKSFESWAEVFPDAVIASAVLERLVHHAHLVPIVGDSYRMKELKNRRESHDEEAKAA